MNQKTVIAILGVAVVILIGTTVYFATINKVSQPVALVPKVVKQQPVPAPATQQPAVQSITSTATDETATWQSYNNQKFGYTIKYPANWNYKIENGQACVRENGKKYNIEGSDACTVSISETTNLDTKRLSINDWAKQKKEKGGATISNLKIGGFEAIQSQDYLGLETVVSKPASNGLEVDIATPNFGDKSQNDPIRNAYNKMLSTLEFIK